MENLKLSIVIVTKYRRTELLNCVRSLLPQLGIDDEVIVVENGSKVLSVEDWVDRRVKYFHLIRGNTVEARNFGIKVAENEVVAFLDDDGYVNSDWTSFLLQAYREHPDAGGVGGSIISKNLGAFGPHGGRTSPWGMVYGDFKGGEGVVESQHLMGGNMSFRKEVLTKVGGFDTMYHGTFLREETDIAIRIRQLGYKLFYQPKARFYHLESKRGRAVVERRAQARSFVLNHTYFYFKNYLSIYPVLILLLPFFFLDTSIMLLKVRGYYRDSFGFFCGWLGFFDGVKGIRNPAGGKKKRRYD